MKPSLTTLLRLVLPVSALWAGLACTRLDKEAPTPSPVDTSAVLPRLAVTADTTGQVRLSFTALAIDRTRPFTLTTTGFRHGRILAQGDTALAYRAFSQTGWTADSGTIRLCQDNRCRSRTLVITNSVKQPEPAAVCIALPGISRLVTLAGVTLDAELPGNTEPGAKIDSIWGYMATAQIKTDSTGITYAPSGPAVFPNVAADDEVFYRVQRPNGLGCYRSSVRFFYPDSCTFSRARPDVLQAPAFPYAVNPLTELLVNDKNCAGASIQNSIVRLVPTQAYPTASRRVFTKGNRGVISDTVLTPGGPQSFYYRPLVAGLRSDTISYFLLDTNELRVSRSFFILHLP